MKRHPSLVALSREHHTALVWAKRAQRGGEGDPHALMEKLIAVFASELEPHFVHEENDLLPVLESNGHIALVAQTLMEHRHLRTQIEQMRAGRVDSLVAFGSALAAHVRFEEREMFPVVESVLRSRLDNGAP